MQAMPITSCHQRAARASGRATASTLPAIVIERSPSSQMF